jgi:hypothetical protein
MFDRIAMALARATSLSNRKADEAAERVICALACEQLQRLADQDGGLLPGERLIVINESPYAAGNRRDGRADLKIVQRFNCSERTTWVEVKPLFRGLLYFNPAKFYSNPVQDPQYTTRSIVLDDIDKLKLRPPKGDGRAFAIVMNVDQMKQKPDQTPTRDGVRITPGQIFWLIQKRFMHTFDANPQYGSGCYGNTAALVMGLPPADGSR